MSRTGNGAWRRTSTVLATALLLAAVAACDSSRVDGVPEGPVSDAELFAQIAEIDHVIDSDDVHYIVNFTDGDSYGGTIVVEDDADLFCVFDQVAAILWMGRETDLSLWVKRSGDSSEITTKRDVGPQNWWGESALAERYGPRPEPGSDPTPAPAPACG